MKDLEIRISESGMSVWVIVTKTGFIKKLFSVCDYESLDVAVQAARDYIEEQNL